MRLRTLETLYYPMVLHAPLQAIEIEIEIKIKIKIKTKRLILRDRVPLKANPDF